MIRLLIVDNARLVCDALAATLKEQADIVTSGVAIDVEDALAQLGNCDLVLVSAGLPHDGALRLIWATTRSNLPVKVLVTGADEDMVLRYLEAGAAGYVLKQESVDDLLRRVQNTCEGLPVLSPRITAALIARLAQLARLTDDHGQMPAGQMSSAWPTRPLRMPAKTVQLTTREQQVLGLLGRGFSNQEIAQTLAIEVGTVKNHVHSILRKLKVSSRYQAALALAPELTSPAARPMEQSLMPVGGMAYVSPE